MIKEWTEEKIINGKRYRVHHAEWDYYGGSRISSSHMVRIDDEVVDDDKEALEIDDEAAGEIFEENR